MRTSVKFVVAGFLAGTSSAAAWAQEVTDIVVTAQKRSESLQKVPIAVTAVGGEALQNAVIRDSQDLVSAVPSLSVTRESTGIQLFLRGVGTQSSQVGQEPAIAVFVDGVYNSSASSGTFQLANIERLEVLKGPQGTLYGRNATGGAINIITKDPSHTAAMSLEGGYGNLNTIYGSVYGTTGLSDTIAIDISGAIRDQRDGFGRNRVTGNDANDTNERTVRSKLLFEPGENARIVLGADYSKTSGGIGMSQRPADAKGRPQIGPVGRLGYYDTQSEFDTNLFVKNYGVSGRVELDVGGARLTSVTAKRWTKAFQNGDLDLLPLSLIRYPLTEDTKQFTQEFNLSGDGNHFTWILGAFYLDGSSGYKPFQIIGSLANATGAPNAGYFINATQDTKSYAGFGQATYEVVTDLRVTGGLRYTSDRRRASGTFGSVSNYTGRGTGTYVIGANIIPTSQTFNKLTWRLAIDYQITPAALAYASYSRGFKSGLYNLIETASLPRIPAAVEPEVLDAYEVGLKSSLFDRRLRLNGALFYYKYKNMQVTQLKNNATNLINAASSTIYGLDLDADAALGVGLSLHTGLGWIPHARYNEFVGAPFFDQATQTVGPRDAGGNRLIRTPRFTLNAGLTHSTEVGSGRLLSSVTYSYSSHYAFGPDNLFFQRAMSLVNGQIKYTLASGFSVRIFGNNILNHKYISQLSEVSGFGLTVSPAPGRTYGAAVGVSF